MHQLQERVEHYKNMSPEELEAIRMADDIEESRKLRAACRRSEYAKSGIDGDMRDRTLVSYKPKTPSQVEAKAAAKGFVTNFTRKTRTGLLYWGACGVGKTHLLQAIVREIYQKKCPVSRYYYVPTLIEKLRTESSAHTDAKSWEGITSTKAGLDRCDILILDDLSKIDGKLHGPFINVIGHIVNLSADTGNPVLLASSNIYPDTLGRSLGEALASRLHQLCDIYEIRGPDARRKEE